MRVERGLAAFDDAEIAALPAVQQLLVRGGLVEAEGLQHRGCGVILLPEKGLFERAERASKLDPRDVRSRRNLQRKSSRALQYRLRTALWRSLSMI